MASHDLKVWPEFYAPLERGEKLFELRRDDRDFKVGDWLKLREWAPPDIEKATPGGYTGARCLRRISYILRPAGHVLGLAIMDGYVILGLMPPFTELSFALLGQRLFLGTIDRKLVRAANDYTGKLVKFIASQQAARMSEVQAAVAQAHVAPAPHAEAKPS